VTAVYAVRPVTDAAVDTVRITRIERQLFDDLPDTALTADDRAFLEEYMSDLVRPYGFALRDAVLNGGTGRRYEEMAEALIAATVSTDDPVDLVILAFAVPDARAGRTTATYRGASLPGDPLAFAVCDQGTAATFTALRLARELARTGDCRRGLVLVVEQATLPYLPDGPAALPARPAAVALRCGDTGPARLAVHRQHAGVPAGVLDALLAAELAELCAGPGEVTLVLGGGLAGRATPPRTVDRVRIAPDGQPATGVWWALADELMPGGPRRVVLADHEPALGYLGLVALDVAG